MMEFLFLFFPFFFSPLSSHDSSIYNTHDGLGNLVLRGINGRRRIWVALGAALNDIICGQLAVQHYDCFLSREVQIEATGCRRSRQLAVLLDWEKIEREEDVTATI